MVDGSAAQRSSDRDLLERFLADRDEAAFAGLVRRHGAMVLSVCRRVLRHAHDAEDACQATFLVLGRKASSIRKRESVAGRLHGVAFRVAARLRRGDWPVWALGPRMRLLPWSMRWGMPCRRFKRRPVRP